MFRSADKVCYQLFTYCLVCLHESIVKEKDRFYRLHDLKLSISPMEMH